MVTICYSMLAETFSFFAFQTLRNCLYSPISIRLQASKATINQKKAFSSIYLKAGYNIEQVPKWKQTSKRFYRSTLLFTIKSTFNKQILAAITSFVEILHCRWFNKRRAALALIHEVEREFIGMKGNTAMYFLRSDGSQIMGG